MKYAIWIVLLLGSGLGMSAFRQHTQAVSEDIFAIMGISKTEARTLMKENLFFATLATPPAAALRKIATGKRPELVKEVGQHMKAYFRTPEVIEAYARYRESLMPGRQESTDLTTRIAEVKKEIERTEADLKQAPADMKKLYEETLLLLRKQLEILQDPSHPEHAIYAGQVSLTPEQQEEIRRQQQAFNKDYPADLQQYIRRKLLDFLELTEDLDFNAKLIQDGQRWRFANPEYESRGPDWKKCFRAGKETIDAARAFAREWANEIR